MPRPLIVVLKSRQSLTVEVTEAFPPDEHDVVVLTDGDADSVVREDVPVRPSAVVTLDQEHWAAEIRRRAAGRPVEIVTNDEYTLQACARLRSEQGLAPRHPGDPRAYRDKVAMKRLLRDGGVRVPRFHAFEPEVSASARALRDVIEEVGIPAVVKPRQEANSRGVQILRSPDELERWLLDHQGEPGWQVDEYVAGDHHHVNALVRHGQITPVQVGRYLGPLLGLESGACLGGRTLPSDTEFAAMAHRLNRQVVGALGGEGAFVVHTEFMVDRSERPVVLEVAARAPGALVSQVARLHAGINLEIAQLRMQAGLGVAQPVRTGVHGAWLWVPVMPGQRFDRAPAFTGGAEVHVRRAGREGHRGKDGTVGASVLLWHTDPDVVSRDLVTALEAAWFTPEHARI